MICRRHRDEKTEGPGATGKVASGGPERRWNNCFYPPFFLSKQIANLRFFTLFYTGMGLLGAQIVNASFLFVSYYQKAGAKCSVFWEGIPDGSTNRRSRKGIK
ncbi:MAG: hypothetical protein LBF62_07555 [Tannerellaceae bacterium]|jgi:hypothetical protein|nr:hypothetical protein [Tannerellaceae bacterium]